MFAQDDGTVVIKLEKMNGVTVNEESKVNILSSIKIGSVRTCIYLYGCTIR